MRPGSCTLDVLPGTGAVSAMTDPLTAVGEHPDRMGVYASKCLQTGSHRLYAVPSEQAVANTV
jgi:hypothetical protein